MPEFVIETDINAPKRTVWQIFSGLSNYENWNPFIVDAVGTFRYDTDLDLKIMTPSGKVVQFSPHVERMEAGENVRWSTGNMLFSRHTVFTLDDTNASGTKFKIDVDFKGLLAGFRKGFVDELENGYRTMSEALKKQAEEQAGGAAASP